jgi:hypothetical protein
MAVRRLKCPKIRTLLLGRRGKRVRTVQRQQESNVAVTRTKKVLLRVGAAV